MDAPVPDNAKRRVRKKQDRWSFPTGRPLFVWFLSAVMSLVRLFTLFFLAAALARAEDFQGSTHALPYDDSIIDYSEATPEDPVALLQRRIARGDLALSWDERFGYLPAVLDALKVPKSSQMLVFSKTSLQRTHI